MANPIKDAVKGIAEGLVGPIGEVIKEFVVDKDERNRLAHEISMAAATHAHQQVMGQIEVNNTQAKHPSTFVAGARPFIMWVCGVGLGINAIVYPLAAFFVDELPQADTSVLLPTLLGLLGLTASRTVEKLNGVARENMAFTVTKG